MHIYAALKPDEYHVAGLGEGRRKKVEMKDQCFPMLSMYNANFSFDSPSRCFKCHVETTDLHPCLIHIFTGLLSVVNHSEHLLNLFNDSLLKLGLKLSKQ